MRSPGRTRADSMPRSVTPAMAVALQPLAGRISRHARSFPRPVSKKATLQTFRGQFRCPLGRAIAPQVQPRSISSPAGWGAHAEDIAAVIFAVRWASLCAAKGLAGHFSRPVGSGGSETPANRAIRTTPLPSAHQN